MSDENIKERLEYLRSQIDAECISMGEISELESLANYIDPSDVVLLQWAGVPEFPQDDEADESAPEQLYRALKVFTETDHIANYVAEHDRKAMEQANEAMTAYEASTETHVWVEADLS